MYGAISYEPTEFSRDLDVYKWKTSIGVQELKAAFVSSVNEIDSIGKRKINALDATHKKALEDAEITHKHNIKMIQDHHDAEVVELLQFNQTLVAFNARQTRRINERDQNIRGKDALLELKNEQISQFCDTINEQRSRIEELASQLESERRASRALRRELAESNDDAFVFIRPGDH